ncbi:MAG: universal stress protein [Caldilineaceae bacterium]
MLNKILAPLDGSVLADTVLPHIVALTRINGTEVTLLHVLETNQTAPAQMGPVNIDPVEWGLRKAEAQTYLTETANRLHQFDLPTENVVLEGRAAERIVEYAQKEDFDLVALSTHGQGGLSGWNLSGVTSKVLHRIRKSTLIIPAHRAASRRQSQGELQPIQYRRILVPLDGSPRAECVLPLAMALARRHEAELILAHVVTPPEMIQRLPLTTEEQQLVDKFITRNQAEATRYFEQLRTRLTPTPTIQILVDDDVERSLANLIERESIDLMILAAHGQSCRSGHAYGHFAESFIEYGSVPLYLYQDLNVDEIASLYAERMLQDQEPPKHHMNTNDYAVK